MPDELYQRLQSDLEDIPKTPENLKQMFTVLLAIMSEHNIQQDGTVEEIERERQKILAEMDAATLSPEQAENAKSGLQALGQTVCDSGIPEAIIAFGMTWKLLHGILKVDEEARQEYRI